jgi:hypothetical protein
MATTTSEDTAAPATRDGELILVDMAFELCREVAEEARRTLNAGEAAADAARLAAVDAAWARYQDAISAPLVAPRRETLRHARAAFNAAAAAAKAIFDAELARAQETYVAKLESACEEVEAALGAVSHGEPGVAEAEPPVEEAAAVPVPGPGDQRALGPRPSPRQRRLLRRGLHAA